MLTRIQHIDVTQSHESHRAKSAKFNLWHLETYLCYFTTNRLTVLFPLPWKMETTIDAISIVLQ